MDRELAKNYQSHAAATEYNHRHAQNAVRRSVTRREGRVLLDLLGTPPETAVLLDLACGTGRLSAMLRESGWNPLSVDRSPEMLAVGLRSGGIAEGQAINASVLCLPFMDQSAHGCVCGRFFHHLEDQEERLRFLTELKRITRGPIVLSLWTRANFQWLRRVLKTRLGRRPSARHALGLKAFKKELSVVGLEVVKTRALYPFVSETVYLRLKPMEGFAPPHGKG